MPREERAELSDETYLRDNPGHFSVPIKEFLEDDTKKLLFIEAPPGFSKTHSILHESGGGLLIYMAHDLSDPTKLIVRNLETGQMWDIAELDRFEVSELISNSKYVALDDFGYLLNELYRKRIEGSSEFEAQQVLDFYYGIADFVIGEIFQNDETKLIVTGHTSSDLSSLFSSLNTISVSPRYFKRVTHNHEEAIKVNEAFLDHVGVKFDKSEYVREFRTEIGNKPPRYWIRLTNLFGTKNIKESTIKGASLKYSKDLLESLESGEELERSKVIEYFSVEDVGSTPHLKSNNYTYILSNKNPFNLIDDYFSEVPTEFYRDQENNFKDLLKSSLGYHNYGVDFDPEDLMRRRFEYVSGYVSQRLEELREEKEVLVQNWEPNFGQRKEAYRIDENIRNRVRFLDPNYQESKIKSIVKSYKKGELLFLTDERMKQNLLKRVTSASFTDLSP